MSKKITVAEFLKNLKHPRADQIRRLDKIIRRVRPSWKPYIAGKDMVGFGRYEYTYASGRRGEWFVVGYDPRKGSITLYSMAFLYDR